MRCAVNHHPCLHCCLSYCWISLLRLLPESLGCNKIVLFGFVHAIRLLLLNTNFTLLVSWIPRTGSTPRHSIFSTQLLPPLYGLLLCLYILASCAIVLTGRILIQVLALLSGIFFLSREQLNCVKNKVPGIIDCNHLWALASGLLYWQQR
jgi:hypothetical protein